MVESIDRSAVVSMASGKGVVGRVFVGAWWGVFQEAGTHAHKGRPGSERTAQARKSKGVVSGVKPARFLRNAAFSARAGHTIVKHVARRTRGRVSV